MRNPKDFSVFCGHPDWFTFIIGVGYVPTEKAPKEAVEAMERHNEYLRMIDSPDYPYYD